MDLQIIISLVSLIALEAVLGIDNVVFLSILVGRLPLNQQKKALHLGLVLAAIMRIGLLFLISIILQLTNPLFTIFGNEFSAKDLVLLAGGLFLLYKATTEIYLKVEAIQHESHSSKVTSTFSKVILQVLIMDMVFSIDSIITAIGMVKEIWIMYVAIILTTLLMLFAANTINDFISKHPTFKILALAFLILIGVSLVAESFGSAIPKGYIYFSMAFTLLVDLLQMRFSSNDDKPIVEKNQLNDEVKKYFKNR